LQDSARVLTRRRGYTRHQDIITPTHHPFLEKAATLGEHPNKQFTVATVRPAATGLTVRRLEGNAFPGDLRPEWDTLVALSPRPTLYLTHDWMRTWWECFRSPNREPYVITASGAAGLRGIAPLVRISHQFCGIPFRRLELMTTGRYAFSCRNLSASLEFIAAGDRQETVRAMAGYLSEHPDDWDYLRFHPLPEDSETLAALPLWAAQNGFTCRVRPVLSNIVVELPGRWEDYLAQLSPGMRKRIRRADAGLRRSADSTITEITSPDDVDACFSEVESIERRCWKGRRRPPFGDSMQAKFYRAVMSTAKEQGTLSLWMFNYLGRNIAYDFGVVSHGSVEMLKGSFIETDAKLSPGVCLTMREFEEYTKRGIRRVNLLWGDGGFKVKWTPKTETCYEMYICNSTFRGRLVDDFYLASGAYRGIRVIRNIPERYWN